MDVDYEPTNCIHYVSIMCVLHGLPDGGVHPGSDGGDAPEVCDICHEVMEPGTTAFRGDAEKARLQGHARCLVAAQYDGNREGS